VAAPPSLEGHFFRGLLITELALKDEAQTTVFKDEVRTAQ
jgi:hypothetical protein